MKKNHKFIIGIFIGVFLSLAASYAVLAYVGNGSNLSYNSANTNLTANTVQGALDELYNSCSVWNNGMAVGDFVSYTPSKSTATATKAMTGYTSNQYVYPNKLKLWRVIRVNANGTVDIVSEYLTSEMVYFSGLDGFKNYVGSLNTIASQFETSGVTSGSRYLGYNGQTLTITNTSKFTTTAPWQCSTGGSCSPAPVESYGGGDTLYQTDYNLITATFGTSVAYVEASGEVGSYWLASRNYTYSNASYYFWNAYSVGGGSAYGNVNLYRKYGGTTLEAVTNGQRLRPVVTLKSGLNPSGSGTYTDPWAVS